MLISLVFWIALSNEFGISEFTANISHLSTVLSFKNVLSLSGFEFSFILSAVSTVSISSSMSGLSPLSDDPLNACMSSLAFSSLENDFSASSMIWCFLKVFSCGSLHFCSTLSARMSAWHITSLRGCPFVLVKFFSLFSNIFFLSIPMYLERRLFAILSGHVSSLWLMYMPSSCWFMILSKHFRKCFLLYPNLSPFSLMFINVDSQSILVLSLFSYVMEFSSIPVSLFSGLSRISISCFTHS